MATVYPENDYRSYLAHSAKGSHWKNGHKYIAIKNGRYIYPEDLVKGVKNVANTAKAVANEARTFKDDAELMGVKSAIGNAMVREADRGNGIIKYKADADRQRRERQQRKAEKKRKRAQKAYNNVALRTLSSFGSSAKKKVSSAAKSGAKKVGKKLMDRYLTTETKGNTTNYYSKKTGKRVAQFTRR